MTERTNEAGVVTVGALLDLFDAAGTPSFAAAFTGYDREATVEAIPTSSQLLLIVTPPTKDTP